MAMTSDATTSFRTFDLDPETSAQWDTMVGGAELHLSARWLRSVEGNLIKTPLYVVRQGADDKIKASAVGYLMEDSQEGSTDSLIRLTRIDSLLASVTPDDRCAQHGSSDGAAVGLQRLMPSLSCGGWTLTNSNILLSSALTYIERTEVRSGLLDELTAAASAAGARSLSFPYVAERNDELRELLLREGFLEFPSSSHFTVDVTWASFPEYLDHFVGRRRGKIRREYHMLRDAGIRFRVVPLDEPLAGILLPLAHRTVEKYQGITEKNHLYERLMLLAEFGSDVILVEHEKTLMGFGVVVQWGDHLYARMVGFNYTAQRKVPLYFGLMYEQVSYAIQRGLRKLEYATTGGAAKTSRGAREFRQYGYVKALDSTDARYVSDIIRAGGESSSAGWKQHGGS